MSHASSISGAPGSVLPPIDPLTEGDARRLLALSLARPVAAQGPTRFALKVGCNERTIRKAAVGEATLRIDFAFNALLSDPGALDALAMHFRRVLVSIDPGTICDMTAISGLLRAAAEYVERMRDARRCHADTLALADLFRPLLPHLAGIVREADALKQGD